MKTKYYATVNVRFHLVAADGTEAVFVHRVRRSAFERDMRNLRVTRSLRRVLNCAFQTLRAGDLVDAMIVADDYLFDSRTDAEYMAISDYSIVTLVDSDGKSDWKYANNFFAVD